MEKLRQQIEQRLSAVTGDACFYYENLATGVCFGHAADKPVVAASVIKLAVLIEAFRQMDADAVRANEMFVIARTDKLPSCGALNYLHDGLCVTFRDLCVLMTILRTIRPRICSSSVWASATSTTRCACWGQKNDAQPPSV